MNYHACETKPLTRQDLIGLIDWLKTKDVNQTYDSDNIDNCLVAQFIKAQGRELVSCGSQTISYAIKGERYSFDIPIKVQEIAYDHPNTFGEALRRAEQILVSWTK